MFLIRLIVYLNVIYFIIAQKFHDDDDPIIGIRRKFYLT